MLVLLCSPRGGGGLLGGYGGVMAGCMGLGLMGKPQWRGKSDLSIPVRTRIIHPYRVRD